MRNPVFKTLSKECRTYDIDCGMVFGLERGENREYT